jgi:membrane-associated phospholipid phosphatase
MTEGSSTDTRWCWLAGAGAFLAAFVTLVVLVSGDWLVGLNEFSRTLVHHPGPRLLRSSMEAASFWGGQAGQTAVVLLGSAVLWRRRRGWAVSLPLVTAGAGVLQLVAKWAVDRPRPNLDPWGFPSAHVLSLVVLLGCIAYLLGTSRLRRGWRISGVGGCAAAVCVVGYSRMYLDAHWLSDVLGGLTMGLAYLLAVIWLASGGGVRTWRGGRGLPLPAGVAAGHAGAVTA